MGGATVLNREVSVSLQEKMTSDKDSKGLRESTFRISRGRISRQRLETAEALRQQHVWHTQTPGRKPPGWGGAREGKVGVGKV